MTSNGIPTKVIALGIGSFINIAELNNMVSAPADRNVILLQDFTRFRDVEEELRYNICPLPPTSNNSLSRICSREKVTVEVNMLS